MSFDRALVINPDYADALYNRAVLMADLGRLEDAAASFERALALAPERADAHRGRARALYAIGDREGALASHGHAIALEDGIAARLERGILLSELGRHREALEDYDCALRLDPDHVAALSNRGAALQELGRDEEAQAAFDRALLLAPDNGELLGNRGAALLRTRQFDEALDCLDRALASRPADAGILSNRGNALLGLGRHADAIETYDRALALAPENALTLNNRGAALNEIGLHERALTSLDDAVAVAPDYAEAWYNRGNALKGGKRIADALASYERALAIGTPLPHALSGCAECAAKLCDWKRTAQVEPELQSHVLGGQSIVSPFTLIGYGASPALQLAAARRHAAHRFPTLPPAMCRNTRRAHDRLRVAYLSANFNRHAMGYLMANLFERHDRSRFEITGISFGPDDGSAIRARIAAAFERFHDVRGVADRDVAKLLDEREIDIAVDVMGYTKDARPGILSHRPAPIQVNYLGYPGTMGADFIDYIMADAVLLPPAAEPDNPPRRRRDRDFDRGR